MSGLEISIAATGDARLWPLQVAHFQTLAASGGSEVVRGRNQLSVSGHLPESWDFRQRGALRWKILPQSKTPPSRQRSQDGGAMDGKRSDSLQTVGGLALNGDDQIHVLGN